MTDLNELTAQIDAVLVIEKAMAEKALLAWRAADARRGLSDHEALLVHADALTRWSERLREALRPTLRAAMTTTNPTDAEPEEAQR